MTVKLLVTMAISLMSNYLVLGQCASSSNIYSFIYNGKTYEVIKENKTWVDAATCAVERGGFLAEIDDALEQNAIFTELSTNADINVDSTVAPDGGGASYVWIGGNDLSVEGNWIWDGDNDGMGPQFWLGNFDGSAVGGLYNNWGNEPDDFDGQDNLGLALTNWPFGVAGQWNDVGQTNTLYFIVEHTTILNVDDIELNNRINLYPNPAVDFVILENNNLSLNEIIIFSSFGQKVKSIPAKNLEFQEIGLSDLSSGIYFFQIKLKNGKSIIKKIIK